MGMVIASLSSEATIPHSLRESRLDSGAQARPSGHWSLWSVVGMAGKVSFKDILAVICGS